MTVGMFLNDKSEIRLTKKHGKWEVLIEYALFEFTDHEFSLLAQAIAIALNADQTLTRSHE